MKNTLIKVLGIVILAVLQFSFLSKISILESIPNLIFILSLVLLIRGFFEDSILVASIGGLFLDLSSPLRFGIYLMVLLASLIFIHFVVLKNLPLSNYFFIYLFITGVFMAVNLIIFLFAGIAPHWQIIIDAAINGFWGVTTYYILNKLVRAKEEIRIA